MHMRMIIGSLLLMYCLHFSFTDRGDQYATFKKMKGKKIKKNKNNCYLNMDTNNFIHYKVWGENTYPFPNFDGCATLCIYMLGFMLVKRAPVNTMRTSAHQ